MSPYAWKVTFTQGTPTFTMVTLETVILPPFCRGSGVEA